MQLSDTATVGLSAAKYGLMTERSPLFPRVSLDGQDSCFPPQYGDIEHEPHSGRHILPRLDHVRGFRRALGDTQHFFSHRNTTMNSPNQS